MRVHALRKLFLFGRYSLAILLPKKWLTDLDVKRGDSVEIELDRKRRRVVLRFGTPVLPKKTDSEPPPIRADREDLEPIPQIQN